MNYNESQKKAVYHIQGPMMVLAGPGSGKTAVITGRTCQLVKSGISASRILVVTFTRAAASEMKERYLRLMGRNSTQVTFGTFHGVFYGILRHTYHLTGENILSEEQKNHLMRELVNAYCKDLEEEDLAANLAREISTVKNNQIALEHYYSACAPEKTFRKVYEEYEKWMRENRKLDFDDIMVQCSRLLKERPEILHAWQQKFQFILIDEFQDINPIQYEIVRMLALPENNLFIVGDDDQSIYQFRGARPELMLNFPKDYPQTERVVLDKNYRSSGNIVKRSQCLIRHNQHRFEKNISTDQEAGAPVAIRGYRNVQEEVSSVAEELLLAAKQGMSYREMALLFRTNQGCRAAVEQLIEHQIPFRMRDVMPDLYDHWIAKDLLTYLSIAGGSRKRSDFLRIANRPNRYLSRDAFESTQVSFEALQEYYEDKEWMCQRIERLEQDIRILSRLTPFGAVNYIRYAMGYEQYVKEYAAYRKMNDTDLIDMLNELQEAAKSQKTVAQWLTHIEEYQKKIREEKKLANDQTDGVTLSTLHSVKGLEYDKVYLLDVNEGIMPYQKAVLPEAQEEERRMFYVGITRARKELTLCYVKERYDKKIEPSRFLDEMLS
ncbi:MAG: ATP-dependent helicase [Fusicatenibacter sp.]|nr:ATP-dependent helicase [Fusicatenibacter sp.]